MMRAVRRGALEFCSAIPSLPFAVVACRRCEGPVKGVNRFVPKPSRGALQELASARSAYAAQSICRVTGQSDREGRTLACELSAWSCQCVTICCAIHSPTPNPP